MKQLGLFFVFILTFGTVLAQNNSGNEYRILMVPQDRTPKSIVRLGTYPEFPQLRHLRSETEVYNVIKAMDKSKGSGKYMDELLMAMGYTGIDDPAFTKDDIQRSSLPFGAIGMLGDGRHQYVYSILVVHDKPTIDCWKVAGKDANDKSLYFIDDCGNAFYNTNPPQVMAAATTVPDEKKEVNVKVKVYARYRKEPCDCCSAQSADDALTSVNYEEEKVLISEEDVDHIEASGSPEVVVKKVYIDVDKGTFRKLKKHAAIEDDKEKTVTEVNYTKN